MGINKVIGALSKLDGLGGNLLSKASSTNTSTGIYSLYATMDAIKGSVSELLEAGTLSTVIRKIAERFYAAGNNVDTVA